MRSFALATLLASLYYVAEARTGRHPEITRAYKSQLALAQPMLNGRVMTTDDWPGAYAYDMSNDAVRAAAESELLVLAEGQTLSFVFEENPTTGHLWIAEELVEGDGEGSLTISRTYTPHASAPGMVGVGGRTRFDVTAGDVDGHSAGKLRFSLGRPHVNESVDGLELDILVLDLQ